MDRLPRGWLWSSLAAGAGRFCLSCRWLVVLWVAACVCGQHFAGGRDLGIGIMPVHEFTSSSCQVSSAARSPGELSWAHLPKAHPSSYLIRLKFRKAWMSSPLRPPLHSIRSSEGRIPRFYFARCARKDFVPI